MFPYHMKDIRQEQRFLSPKNPEPHINILYRFQAFIKQPRPLKMALMYQRTARMALELQHGKAGICNLFRSIMLQKTRRRP